MSISGKVVIREVATRDGFQSWPKFVPTERKIEIVEAMIEAGLKEIEVTSFVNPKAIPQMADAAEVLARVPRPEGVKYTALAPNLKGAEMAFAAGCDRLGVFISATDRHNMANVRRSVDDSLSDLRNIMSQARERRVPIIGAVAVAFGCPYQGDVAYEQVFKVARGYLEGGAELILLADTTGMGTPNRVKALVEAFMKEFPGAPFGLHLHNNRGTAMTNLYAALQCGVDCFDTALGGIGGCPNVPQAAGNLPTSDVVFMLEEMGVDTGIDMVKIIKAAHRMEEILGRNLPGQVMKSGPRDPELAHQVCGISHTV